MQTARITKTGHTGKISQNRKERSGFSNEYAVIVLDNKASSPVIARVYYTKSGTAHACIWVNSSKAGIYVSGGGKASGYGYHKASAALANALEDAGIVLSEPIDGRGESAMTEALEAIAVELGYKNTYIHHSHA